MTHFVYLVEGEPHVGTVKDYAEALEHAYYSGLDVDNRVWSFGPDGPNAVVASVSTTPYDENDYAHVTVSVGDDVAAFRIDGRA